MLIAMRPMPRANPIRESSALVCHERFSPTSSSCLFLEGPKPQIAYRVRTTFKTITTVNITDAEPLIWIEERRLFDPG
jgi:hypothetical protein